MDDADRAWFLGGSDAPAVLGLSPWQTPVELYQAKLDAQDGITPVVPNEMRQRIFRRGHRLEPYIRDMVVERAAELGLRLDVSGVNIRYVDSEWGWLRAEIDFDALATGYAQIGGEFVEFDGEHINADCKSVGWAGRDEWGAEHTEDVPIHYAAQFMTGLMVTQRRYCLVASLPSFDQVRIHWVVRDEETIAAIRRKLVSFWCAHVLPRVPPDPINFADVKLLFSESDGSGMLATPELAHQLELLRAARDDKKAASLVEQQVSFAIASALGPRSAIFDNRGRVLATFKTDSDGTRVLRLSKPTKGKKR